MHSDLLETIANKIVERGLAVPCIFLLELHKPLSGIAGHLFQSLGPLSTLIFPSAWREQVASLLSHPQHIEDLILRIELLAKAAR